MIPRLKAWGQFAVLCAGGALVLVAIPVYALGVAVCELWRADIRPAWRRVK